MTELCIELPPSFCLGNNTTTAGLLTGNRTSGCSHDDAKFKYLVYTITYLPLFPIALLSNSGALLVFLLQARKRSSASCIVMSNLAMSDLCFSLTLPLRLAYYFRNTVWDLPDWLCRLCVYFFYVNLYTSVLFLTLLSVLRWLAVVQPLRHLAIATPTRILLVCLCVWGFVGGASVPFLAQGVHMRGGLPRCFEPAGLPSWGRVLVLNYVALVLGFLLPFLIIIGCYSGILCRLSPPRLGQDHRPSLADALGNGARRPSLSCESPAVRGRRLRRRRSVILVSMVTATFLVCFLPYHVVRSLHLHAVCGGWSCATLTTLQRAAVATLSLAALNSAVNPLLYYYSTSSFRENASRLSQRMSLSSSLRRQQASVHGVHGVHGNSMALSPMPRPLRARKQRAGPPSSTVLPWQRIDGSPPPPPFSTVSMETECQRWKSPDTQPIGDKTVLTKTFTQNAHPL